MKPASAEGAAVEAGFGHVATGRGEPRGHVPVRGRSAESGESRGEPGSPRVRFRPVRHARSTGWAVALDRSRAATARAWSTASSRPKGSSVSFAIAVDTSSNWIREMWNISSSR